MDHKIANNNLYSINAEGFCKNRTEKGYIQDIKKPAMQYFGREFMGYGIFYRNTINATYLVS